MRATFTRRSRPDSYPAPGRRSRRIVLATFKRRPILAVSLLVAITLTAVTLGGAGLARWRGSQVRSQARG